jgi:hypothetical protein
MMSDFMMSDFMMSDFMMSDFLNFLYHTLKNQESDILKLFSFWEAGIRCAAKG